MCVEAHEGALGRVVVLERRPVPVRMMAQGALVFIFPAAASKITTPQYFLRTTAFPTNPPFAR